MNLFEFFYFAIYLSMLTIAIVAIQIYEPGKQSTETTVLEESQEQYIEKEFEEPDSDDEQAPFNPETEEYEMTENPMLRHRHTQENQAPLVEEVD